jgi:uncharacterized protein YifN (PemK superfamily)
MTKRDELVKKYEDAKAVWLTASNALVVARARLDDAADKMGRAGNEMMQELREAVERKERT